MKKGRGNSRRVYNNRLLYTLIVIGILAIIGVAVYADAPVTPIPNPGHYISEIQTCNTTGDILEMVQTEGILNWSCVQAPSAPDLSGYETTSALSNTLASYETTSALTSALASALGGYETTSALTSALAGYYPTTNPSGYTSLTKAATPAYQLNAYCNTAGIGGGIVVTNPTCNTLECWSYGSPPTNYYYSCTGGCANNANNHFISYSSVSCNNVALGYFVN